LCYVSRRRSIDDEDIIHFQELLRFVDPGTSIDLLIDSPGGDVHVAEKLVHMVMGVVSPDDLDVEEGEFRVIVPDQAKSAATLIALGAKTVVMSNTSELGPIDPQILRRDSDGTPVQHSVFDYLNAHESAANALSESPDDLPTQARFKHFDPVVVHHYEQVVEEVRVCAENLMKRYGGNYTQAPSMLLDTHKFHAHNHVIDWKTARDSVGLNVEFMAFEDMQWQLYWYLYRHLRRAVSDNEKIFESRHISVIT